MSTTTEVPHTMPLADLARTASGRLASAPEWIRALQKEAADRFAEVGLPTRRDEDWRHTPLKPIENTTFRVASESTATVGAIEGIALPGLDGPRLVFLDGRYAPEHSTLSPATDGVTVLPLAEAMATEPAFVREHLGQHAPIDTSSFTALNTACFDDGAVIHVARGVAADAPIYLLSVSTTSESVAIHPRLLIVAEESAEVTVVEDFASLESGAFLTNAVTEIVVGANAHVQHYFIERESIGAFNVSTLRVEQERDSNFSSHSALIGGAIVRNNVNPVLKGEGCHSLLNGLYVGRGTQHLDNHMRVEHSAPNCDSRQYYRGILEEDAHGVFSGRIVVAQCAQKTDAIQQNQNLLLSPKAQANTKPQLEIYADDVRCTHGATIGELDEEALFYLRSRGLSTTSARGMLVYAFASESLARMELEPIRDALHDMLAQQLPEHGLDGMSELLETT